MSTSKIFSARAIRSLERIGDILCPENGDFPAYSKTGCVEHVDLMVSYAPESDLKDLNMLLTVLSFMPTFILTWLINKMSNSHNSNGALSTTFRQLDFGLKGIVLGTYYSGKVGKNYKGKKPTEVINFEINRIVE